MDDQSSYPIDLTIYKTSDGNTWCTKETADQWEKLISLVERSVPYTDNKKLVLNFLLDNRKELKEILK